MSWEGLGSRWNALRDSVRSRWDKISDADFEAIGGSREKLVEKNHQSYGISRADAEREADEWLKRHHRTPAKWTCGESA
jgi:hypothetical protein